MVCEDGDLVRCRRSLEYLHSVSHLAQSCLVPCARQQRDVASPERLAVGPQQARAAPHGESALKHVSLAPPRRCTRARPVPTLALARTLARTLAPAPTHPPARGRRIEKGWRLAPDSTEGIERVEVVRLPRGVSGEWLAWRGAASLPTLDSAAELWITRKDWVQRGVMAAREACAFTW